MTSLERILAAYASVPEDVLPYQRFGYFLTAALNFTKDPHESGSLFYIEDDALALACERFSVFLNKAGS